MFYSNRENCRTHVFDEFDDIIDKPSSTEPVLKNNNLEASRNKMRSLSHYNVSHLPNVT